jgi:hypothetical protein
MANPQPDRFVRWSKEHFDALTRSRMPATHLAVCMVVVRMTWGHGGERQAPVSIGCLRKATGRSRSSLQSALDDLMREGVLTEVAPPSFGSRRILAVQKDYEAWGKYALAPDEIPDFLRHDWGRNQYRQSVQVNEAEQGAQSVQNSTGTADTPVPAERTEQYRQGGPLREKTTTDRDLRPLARRKAAAPKVTAPSEADWQVRADDLLAQSAFPFDLRRLAELLAEENKSGKVNLGRVVRALYEPLVALEGEFPHEAIRHGLRSAITAGAPNATYVRKVAAGYGAVRSAAPGARASGNSGGALTQYDLNFLTEPVDESEGP